MLTALCLYRRQLFKAYIAITIRLRYDVVLSPLLHKSGIIYLLLLESHHHLIPSNVVSKLTTLPHHSTHHLATPQHLRFNFFNFGALTNFLHYITLRQRYDDTTTHSTTREVIEITICVRFDCDTTTTRLRRKIDMFIFCSR